MAKSALPENLVISQQGGAGGTIQVNNGTLKKASSVLRAINHPLRQTMLQLLDEQKRVTVTEIFTKLNLEQSVASQHLAILRRTGIVKTEREGKNIFYMVNKVRVAGISRLIDELA